MSFYQNKLQNAYINTTTNASYLITSTYQSDNSLVNKGKSEFEDYVVFDRNIAIGKSINSSYALDVSGNIRVNGGIVPNLNDDLVFNGNIQAVRSLGIGKTWNAAYALDVSGNVRIQNGNVDISGNLTIQNGGSIIGGNIPSLTATQTFSGNQSFSGKVGIGKDYNSSYSLDISGNVRIQNGTLIGIDYASLNNTQTFTGYQSFSNAVGFGKIYDSSYTVDISGNLRVSGLVVGGNLVSSTANNEFTGYQSFLNPVGMGKTYDLGYALDVSGNMRIQNGNLTGGNVASLIAENTFTQRTRFNNAITINRAYDTFFQPALDVSGKSRFTGQSVFIGQASFTLNPTVNTAPSADNNLVNLGYANTTYGKLTSNNIWTANNDFNGGINLFYQPPYSLSLPTDSNHVVNKQYVDTHLIDYATANTTYSGINDYTILPTSTVYPSIDPQFTTKLYVDDRVATKPGLSDNNTWLNYNTFQEDVGFQGANFTTSASTACLFQGTSSFTNLPTCTASPTTSTELVPLGYISSNIVPKIITQDTSSNWYFQNSMTALTSGTSNTAYGNDTLKLTTTGSSNTAVGYQAGDSNTTGGNNVFIGTGAGGNATNCNRCVFIGTNSGTFADANYSDAVAIGYGVVAGGNYQIALGGAAHTVSILGSLRIKTQNLTTTYTITGNYTMSSPYYEYYLIDTMEDITITMPSGLTTIIGVSFTFRRVNGSTTAVVYSASSNIIPINQTTTTSNVILASGEYMRKVSVLQQSSSPITYRYYTTAVG